VGAGTRHPAPGAAAPDTGRTEFRSIKVIDLDGAPEADRFPHGARAIKVIRRRRTGKAHPSVETVYALTSLDHRAAGHSHVTVDGTLVRTDRCRVPGPTARADRPERRVDLWWSGKHAAHGGNVQVIAAPDGWPIWTSGVRPGREHDTTALRGHAEALPLLTEWTDGTHAVLADLGYEGERAALTIPVKHTAGRRLSTDQRTVNLLHAATRAPAERGNSLLKTTFKALRRISLCPWRIGAITAAALVLLHREYGRTT
jgi:hypothetical protein